jgi:hypothetical protein
MIYRSINQAVFERIPPDAHSLLDVGCGGGVFGAAVKSARDCTVVGVTYSAAEAVQARQRIDRVEVAARINHAALRRSPGLFGVQFVLRCVPAAA